MSGIPFSFNPTQVKSGLDRQSDILIGPDLWPDKPTRFCLYGGPGAGKSAEAAVLYAALKAARRNVELVRERIKEFAYLGRSPTPAEKLRFFTSELAEEFAYCQLGLDMVTDSPLWLAAYYARKARHMFTEDFEHMARMMDDSYSTLHVMLPRRFGYDPVGRYQKAEEALAMDEDIYQYLVAQKVDLLII